MKLMLLNLANYKTSPAPCCFEEWNSTAKAIRPCGAPSVVKAGNRNLCAEHAVFAAARGGDRELFIEGNPDRNGKPTFRQVSLKPFLDALRAKNASAPL
ncbi:MAG TPA: hypothetical protein P5142_00235 [Spirochaetia bacterium]|nr:hypothetical protein [Spirochaetia bacterium]